MQVPLQSTRPAVQEIDGPLAGPAIVCVPPKKEDTIEPMKDRMFTSGFGGDADIPRSAEGIIPSYIPPAGSTA